MVRKGQGRAKGRASQRADESGRKNKLPPLKHCDKLLCIGKNELKLLSRKY